MLTPTRSTLAASLLTCVIGLYSLTALSYASEPLPKFSVRYVLENNFIKGGEAKLSLTKKEDHYQVLLETKPTGVFRLTKKGKIRETAELPSLSPPFLSDVYTFTNFGKKDRSFTAAYNRKNGEATIVTGASATNVTIKEPVVDRLSMTLTLMQRLRDQPDVNSFSITTMDAKGVETYDFTRRGQQTLDTRLGKLDTIRVDRTREGSRRTIVTWLAIIGPDALPVPVQIEQYKDNDMVVRLRITDFSVIE